jgi:hypothetical protein
VNAPSPENRLWRAHLELLHHLGGGAPARTVSVTAAQAERARVGEWTAAPPGRLGRRLLPEIERYLQFFALAQE